jgi:CBS domain containing-hemolysin-like protein
MGATEEQMNLVASSSMDHVAYILILFSLAAIVFLFANMLIHLYDRLANPLLSTKDLSANGYTGLNGRPMEEGRAHDAEEFELEGLTSDDEDEDEERRMLRRSREANQPTPVASNT